MLLFFFFFFYFFSVPAPDDAIIEAQYPDFSTNRPDYIAADDVVPTNDLTRISIIFHLITKKQTMFLEI